MSFQVRQAHLVRHHREVWGSLLCGPSHRCSSEGRQGFSSFFWFPYSSVFPIFFSLVPGIFQVTDLFLAMCLNLPIESGADVEQNFRTFSESSATSDIWVKRHERKRMSETGNAILLYLTWNKTSDSSSRNDFPSELSIMNATAWKSTLSYSSCFLQVFPRNLGAKPGSLQVPTPRLVRARQISWPTVPLPACPYSSRKSWFPEGMGGSGVMNDGNCRELYLHTVVTCCNYRLVNCVFITVLLSDIVCCYINL